MAKVLKQGNGYWMALCKTFELTKGSEDRLPKGLELVV